MSWKAWYSVAVAFFTVIIFTAVNVLFTVHQSSKAREENRQWCTTFSLLIQQGIDTPPISEYGRKLLEQFNVLYERFDCKEG